MIHLLMISIVLIRFTITVTGMNVHLMKHGGGLQFQDIIVIIGLLQHFINQMTRRERTKI